MNTERESNHAEMQASQVYNQYICWSVRQSNVMMLTTSKVFPPTCLKTVTNTKSVLNCDEWVSVAQ